MEVVVTRTRGFAGGVETRKVKLNERMYLWSLWKDFAEASGFDTLPEGVTYTPSGARDIRVYSVERRGQVNLV